MCRRNSFVDREGRGDTAEELNPFPGEESVELVETAVPGLLVPTHKLRDITLCSHLPQPSGPECIWGGVSMATWSPHLETSEKITGGIPKNGDQRPSAFGGVTKVLSSPQDTCGKKTQ